MGILRIVTDFNLGTVLNLKSITKRKILFGVEDGFDFGKRRNSREMVESIGEYGGIFEGFYGT